MGEDCLGFWDGAVWHTHTLVDPLITVISFCTNGLRPEEHEESDSPSFRRLICGVLDGLCSVRCGSRAKVVCHLPGSR